MTAPITPLSGATLWRVIAPARQFFRWYVKGLCSAPTFTAGYLCGGVVVAVMMTIPSIAYALIHLALAKVP